MAKRTGGGDKGEPDWRTLLAAAVVEHGTRRVVGPYVLTIPRPAFSSVAAGGELHETELPNGDRLLTYSPPREAAPGKSKR